MIIKKYVVEQMQQAMKQIKEELGPDAIIVSTQKVRGSGLIGLVKKKLEVTAVLDEPKELPAPPKFKQIAEPAEPKPIVLDIQPVRTVEEHHNPIVYEAANLIRSQNQTENGNEEAEKDAAALLLPTEFKPLYDEAVNRLQEEQEGERLPAMTEQPLNKTDQAYNSDFKYRWRKKLIDLDIDRDIAEKLLSGLEAEVNSGTGQRDDLTKLVLIDKVTDLIKPAYQDAKQPKFIAFIGPPGVGKTTTLAKLATRMKLLQGKKVALITVYTYRYGTADQLKIYGEAIDVPVEVVMTPAELRQATERHADKDYVLIDTVGRSSKNTGHVLELKGFLETIAEPKHIYLVLGAPTKERDLFRMIKDFQIAHYNGYIFTKTDETETLGSLLNVVAKTGLPVLYTTYGQTIPDDIEIMQPRKLARLIFRSVDRHEEYDY